MTTGTGDVTLMGHLPLHDCAWSPEGGLEGQWCMSDSL